MRLGLISIYTNIYIYVDYFHIRYCFCLVRMFNRILIVRLSHRIHRTLVDKQHQRIQLLRIKNVNNE